VPRPSHQFGGDWVTNEEVVSGVIFAKVIDGLGEAKNGGNMLLCHKDLHFLVRGN
jgi:hypothetical protein